MVLLGLFSNVYFFFFGFGSVVVDGLVDVLFLFFVMCCRFIILIVSYFMFVYSRYSDEIVFLFWMILFVFSFCLFVLVINKFVFFWRSFLNFFVVFDVFVF